MTKNDKPVDSNGRRRRLSDSFNRGAQTMEEATKSAQAMMASIGSQGLFLRTQDYLYRRFRKSSLG